jgi:hypothetical protein
VIDFRYHLVSIIAVFLALAVGLVVGSTAFSPAAEEVLSKARTELANRNSQLVKENSQLKNQVSADEVFAQANSGRLIDGLLPGETVVLVVAPNADSAVTDGVTTALTQAGATVTGQVQLQSSFMDTSGENEAALTQLARQLATSAGVSLQAPLDQTVVGQQDAAQVIAASILSRTPASSSSSASQAVLDGFSQGGFLTVAPSSGSSTLAPATLAVLVTPGGVQPSGSTDGTTLVAMAQELKSAGDATVMAGSSTSVQDSGSAINAEDSAGQVSTVDYADTPQGQIMVVQALRLILNGKAPTDFGIGPAAAPSPPPTPSPSPSNSSSARPGGHK